MSFSYDNSLPANLDWVRRLINDVNSSSYFFEDEELLAYIAEANQSVPKAVKYLAAAAALDTMHQAWISKGKGVASKKVDDLAITFGTGVGINVDLAMEQKITHLKKKAASLLSVSPHSFRML
jgi:hypothetical protein